MIRRRRLVVVGNHNHVAREVLRLDLLEGQAIERVGIRRIQHGRGGELEQDLPALVARDVEQHLVEVAAVAAADDGASVAAQVVGESEARREVVVVAFLLARLDRVLQVGVDGSGLEVVTDTRGSTSTASETVQSSLKNTP